ncbi:MAG TPA: PLP-dependent aspartate aminotransferase family protein [Thermoanaerobaculia bacterium]|nr:PLP-dependent aspartate aminotransferase family protein [Thermoanaerobaculia bacterium]
MKPRGIDTKAIHGGMEPGEHHSAVSVPIYQTSTFAFSSAEEGCARFAGTSPGPIYTRFGNPTVHALEECVAELESGCGAIATATGMGAITTVLLAMLERGDHIIATVPLYGATKQLIEKRLARFGISATFVAANDNRALELALQPQTRMIYVETPANPTLDLVDLIAASTIARSAGVPLVVDNTFAGPKLQRPIEFGADVVLHSMTKSLNGHSDVIAGIVIARDPIVLKSLRETAIAFGMTIDPHQAWLVLRGIRTLGMRIDRAQENAIELAKWLEAREDVAWVRYPGLRSHPQYELAKAQMSGPGSVIAFEMRGGAEAAEALLDNLQVITLAVSLGGIESLVEHPASMTHASIPQEEQRAEGITPGLIRLAVGCEDAGDLRDDLERAFARVSALAISAV